jgi:hypothetical protein
LIYSKLLCELKNISDICVFQFVTRGLEQDETDSGRTTELAKTPRALSAMSSNIGLMAADPTSPKFGIGLMGLYGQPQPQARHSDAFNTSVVNYLLWIRI